MGVSHVAGSVLIGAFVLVAGCVEDPAQPNASAESSRTIDRPAARRLSVQCTRSENEIVTFRGLARPDSLTLEVPAEFGGGTRRLSAVPAARGEKYADQNVGVWRKASTATLEIDGERFEDCTLVPQTENRRESQRPGVQFRAVGQEPGWLLEVAADSLRFTWAYGQHEVTAPEPERETEGGRILYTAEADRGTVRVVAKPQQCTDPMNGRLFTHTVTVMLSGDKHTGCGRRMP